MTPTESYDFLTVDPSQPGWHRAAIGGLWDDVGQLQFKYLVAHGMRPDHHVLDIGCGSLRAGVHLIRALDPGHYHGFDRHRELIDAGLEHELSPVERDAKLPDLWQTERFDIPSSTPPIDMALAQSVFTHLPLNKIALCLARLRPALQPNGRLFATIFENQFGLHHTERIAHPSPEGDFYTYADSDPYHYTLNTFEWVGEQLGYRVAYVGDWGHPRDQRMLILQRVAFSEAPVHAVAALDLEPTPSRRAHVRDSGGFTVQSTQTRSELSRGADAQLASVWSKIWRHNRS